MAAKVHCRRDNSTCGPGLRGIRIICLLFILVQIYLYVPFLLFDSVHAPALPSLVPAVFLVFLHIFKEKTGNLIALGLYVAIPIVTVMAAPGGSALVLLRLRGYCYFLYSVLMAYGLYLEIRTWPKRKLAGLLAVVATSLIVGAFLENVGVLRGVSDAFRYAVFSRGVYNSDARDIVFFGLVRPKLFTSEPSHLAKGLLITIVLWLIVSQAKFKYVLYLMFLATGLLVIRSPVLILGVPICIVVLLQEYKWKLSSWNNKINIWMVCWKIKGNVGWILVIAILVTAWGSGSVLSRRVNAFVSGGDESSRIRLLVPMVVAGKVLKESPLFGAGISGSEGVLDAISDTFVQLGIDKMRSEEKLVRSVTNGFWMFWISFGIFGGVLELCALVLMVRAMGAGTSVVVVFLVLSLAVGTVHGVRLQSYLFSLIAASRLAKGSIGKREVRLQDRNLEIQEGKTMADIWVSV